eukprot:Rhum_TRINITY_DN2035_c0_g1::Rhum_TRINITY_DN2035_c0_g1_i1::g.5356::m.5356
MENSWVIGCAGRGDGAGVLRVACDEQCHSRDRGTQEGKVASHIHPVAVRLRRSILLRERVLLRLRGARKRISLVVVTAAGLVGLRRLTHRLLTHRLRVVEARLVGRGLHGGQRHHDVVGLVGGADLLVLLLLLLPPPHQRSRDARAAQEEHDQEHPPRERRLVVGDRQGRGLGVLVHKGLGQCAGLRVGHAAAHQRLRGRLAARHRLRQRLRQRRSLRARAALARVAGLCLLRRVHAVRSRQEAASVVAAPAREADALAVLSVRRHFVRHAARAVADGAQVAVGVAAVPGGTRVAVLAGVVRRAHLAVVALPLVRAPRRARVALEPRQTLAAALRALRQHDGALGPVLAALAGRRVARHAVREPERALGATRARLVVLVGARFTVLAKPLHVGRRVLANVANTALKRRPGLLGTTVAVGINRAGNALAVLGSEASSTSIAVRAAVRRVALVAHRALVVVPAVAVARGGGVVVVHDEGVVGAVGLHRTLLAAHVVVVSRRGFALVAVSATVRRLAEPTRATGAAPLVPALALAPQLRVIRLDSNSVSVAVRVDVAFVAVRVSNAAGHALIAGGRVVLAGITVGALQLNTPLVGRARPLSKTRALAAGTHAVVSHRNSVVRAVVLVGARNAVRVGNRTVVVPALDAVHALAVRTVLVAGLALARALRAVVVAPHVHGVATTVNVVLALPTGDALVVRVGVDVAVRALVAVRGTFELGLALAVTLPSVRVRNRGLRALAVAPPPVPVVITLEAPRVSPPAALAAVAVVARVHGAVALVALGAPPHVVAVAVVRASDLTAGALVLVVHALARARAVREGVRVVLAVPRTAAHALVTHNLGAERVARALRGCIALLTVKRLEQTRRALVAVVAVPVAPASARAAAAVVRNSSGVAVAVLLDAALRARRQHRLRLRAAVAVRTRVLAVARLASVGRQPVVLALTQARRAGRRRGDVRVLRAAVAVRGARALVARHGSLTDVALGTRLAEVTLVLVAAVADALLAVRRRHHGVGTAVADAKVALDARRVVADVAVGAALAPAALVLRLARAHTTGTSRVRLDLRGKAVAVVDVGALLAVRESDEASLAPVAVRRRVVLRRAVLAVARLRPRVAARLADASGLVGVRHNARRVVEAVVLAGALLAVREAIVPRLALVTLVARVTGLARALARVAGGGRHNTRRLAGVAGQRRQGALLAVGRRPEVSRSALVTLRSLKRSLALADAVPAAAVSLDGRRRLGATRANVDGALRAGRVVDTVRVTLVARRARVRGRAVVARGAGPLARARARALRPGTGGRHGAGVVRAVLARRALRALATRAVANVACAAHVACSALVAGVARADALVVLRRDRLRAPVARLVVVTLLAVRSTADALDPALRTLVTHRAGQTLLAADALARLAVRRHTRRTTTAALLETRLRVAVDASVAVDGHDTLNPAHNALAAVAALVSLHARVARVSLEELLALTHALVADNRGVCLGVAVAPGHVAQHAVRGRSRGDVRAPVTAGFAVLVELRGTVEALVSGPLALASALAVAAVRGHLDVGGMVVAVENRRAHLARPTGQSDLIVTRAESTLAELTLVPVRLSVLAHAVVTAIRVECCRSYCEQAPDNHRKPLHCHAERDTAKKVRVAVCAERVFRVFECVANEVQIL